MLLTPGRFCPWGDAFLRPFCTREVMSVKVIIVSNRLPVSVAEVGGQMQVTPSPGGLASGLRTYLQSPRCTLQSGYTWVGWPGGSVRTELQPEVSRWCEEKYSARPVFLSSEESHAFYDGFCNQTLWPLFHYFPSQVSYDEHAWSYYERV